jgi:ankyrin repeat protein
MTQENISKEDVLFSMATNFNEDGDSILTCAIIQEKDSLVLDIINNLKKHSNILNISNTHQQTPLHLAVITNQSKIVRALISRGARPSSQDTDGNTPLHIACKNNFLGCVIALTRMIDPIERYQCTYPLTERVPQDYNIYNYAGQGCLHMAAIHGHQDIVRFLLGTCYRNKVNLPEYLHGKSILHIAVEKGYYSMIKSLLKHSNQLDINKTTYSGHSALDIAIGSNRSKHIKLLKLYNGQCLHESTDEADDTESDDLDDIIINMNSLHFERSKSYDDICFQNKPI